MPFHAKQPSRGVRLSWFDPVLRVKVPWKPQRRAARPILSVLLLINVVAATGAEALSGADIVKHCYYKYAGDDQRSRLVIVITDRNGKGVKSEYRRLWKLFDGKDNVIDKVILFAESPLDSRGVNFMRWGYTTKSGKPTDQWVYLPEMNMVRRVSQRDPDNMDWGYTDEDLRIRDLDEDEHRFIQIDRIDGQDFYVVESIPRHDSAYGKRITYFSKTDEWEECAPHQVDYYDNKGELLKQEFITWQRPDGAWVWDTAVMYNVRTKISATYQMLETEVNIGLDDRLFSERQLRRGYPGP